MVSPVGTTQLAQVAGSGGELGKDAFLKILIEELRHQDPLQPVDARDFVNQLTALRQLEVMEDVKGLLEQILQKIPTKGAV